jgi:hypothetical protein
LGGRGSRGVALAGDPDVVAIDLAADPEILDAGWQLMLALGLRLRMSGRADRGVETAAEQVHTATHRDRDDTSDRATAGGGCRRLVGLVRSGVCRRGCAPKWRDAVHVGRRGSDRDQDESNCGNDGANYEANLRHYSSSHDIRDGHPVASMPGTGASRG